MAKCTDVAYGARPTLGGPMSGPSHTLRRLRSSAVSQAISAIGLRAQYAMPGTDVAYRATSAMVRHGYPPGELRYELRATCYVLRASCYGMSGTKMVWAARVCGGGRVG
eukprot:3583044-Rhodomonas_salina.2